MDASAFDPWIFIAGLGLFLFGMVQLELGLAAVVGPSMRRLLRRSTRHPLQGILTGTVATAILQSSSVVTLMVLAFVGAGTLTLSHALGIVIGANLGTTFTGWVVATLGFKIDLETIALPLVGLGGLTVVFVRAGHSLGETGRIAFGLGLLLLGLGYMKASIQDVQAALDVQAMASWPPIVFAIVGFVFTAIIRSSSGAMMITLSALAAGQIELLAAAALIIGADLGTTTTALLGGLKGRAEKRRVAMAHFLFNLITDVAAFLLLVPLLYLVQEIIGISDPLYALVAFHSSFNVMGILMFAPVLGPFAAFLSRRFSDDTPATAEFISRIPVEVSDAAMDALHLETTHLIARVMRHNLSALDARGRDWPPVKIRSGRPGIFALGATQDEYANLKHLEGEVLEFTLALQQQSLASEDARRVSAEILAIRHALQSAKAMKDVRHDLRAYREAGDHRERLVTGIGDTLVGVYAELSGQWRLDEASSVFSALAEHYAANRARYEDLTRAIYDDLTADRYSPEEVSGALNINREVYSSTKALIESVSHHLLSPGQVEDLEAVPPTS
jgi:phosphate:Na+ symporter